LLTLVGFQSLMHEIPERIITLDAMKIVSHD
jgi:hypothetical protein